MNVFERPQQDAWVGWLLVLLSSMVLVVLYTASTALASPVPTRVDPIFILLYTSPAAACMIYMLLASSMVSMAIGLLVVTVRAMSAVKEGWEEGQYQSQGRQVVA